MDIIANQTAWKQALDILSHIRSSSGSAVLPILNCVLIQALDTGLTLTRTDRERQLRAPLHTDQVTGQGEVAVDARKLASLIAALPAAARVRARLSETGRLTLAATVGERTVSRFTLGTLPGCDFPLMDLALDREREPGGASARAADPGPAAVTGAVTAGGQGGGQAGQTPGLTARLTLPGQRLRAVLDATSFAMAKQDVRYYLNGLLLEWHGETLLLVGTDGHRLAHVGLRAAIDGDPGQAIVPADSVAILARIGAETGDREVTMEVNRNRLAVAWHGCELISKLIDGRYPEWRRVVPKHPQPAARWVLNVAETTAALHRVKILSHEKFHGVALEVREEQPQILYLTTANTQADEAEEALPLEAPCAAGRWGFQIDYLLDVLSHCPVATVDIRLGDASSSALLTPGLAGTDDDLDDPEWVIMPMLL